MARRASNKGPNHMDPFFEEIRKKERRRRISLIISGLISVIAIGGIFFADQIESMTSGLFNSSSNTISAEEWNTDNLDTSNPSVEEPEFSDESSAPAEDSDLFADNTPEVVETPESSTPSLDGKPVEESTPAFEDPIEVEPEETVTFEEPITRGTDPSSFPVVEVSSERIYKMADEMPSYPGGLSARKRYFDRNISNEFSSLASNMGQAKVWLQFVVETNGKISSVRVVQGLNSKFDQEAIRLASKMPLWEPGKIDGERVRVYYTIPVDFKRS